jgi:hypothetical protein
METENRTGEHPQKRGFAAMTTEQRKKIASMGGKAAHQLGKAHQFTSAEAAAAGKKRRRRANEPADSTN